MLRTVGTEQHYILPAAVDILKQLSYFQIKVLPLKGRLYILQRNDEENCYSYLRTVGIWFSLIQFTIYTAKMAAKMASRESLINTF